jgi:pimeloyl-ACP methyl ester carboxylesterase
MTKRKRELHSLFSQSVWVSICRGMVMMLADSVLLSGAQMVSAGGQQLYLNCSGQHVGPTVVFEAGAGASSGSFAKVQGQVEKFAHVCSYDRAGQGKSDKPTGQQSEIAIVEDLHQLLLNAHEDGPYVLVGHSLGGIYVRAFQRRYPQLVKGLVLVDSSHEEQLNRFTALSSELGRQFASQGGRYTYDDMYRLWGQLRPGETLQWRVDLPIVLIEHQQPPPKPATPSSKPTNALPPIDQTWHEMQVDLSRRSPCAQLWEAPKQGHDIPDEQPELVARAVRKVMREMQNGCEFAQQ